MTNPYEPTENYDAKLCSTAVTHFWVWLSERCFTLCGYFEHKAIRRHVLDAYRTAINDPTEHNLRKAQSALNEASCRLGHDSIAAHTVARCFVQVNQLMRELSQ
jgi:hypothetical protein